MWAVNLYIRHQHLSLHKLIRTARETGPSALSPLVLLPLALSVPFCCCVCEILSPVREAAMNKLLSGHLVLNRCKQVLCCLAELPRHFNVTETQQIQVTGPGGLRVVTAAMNIFGLAVGQQIHVVSNGSLHRSIIVPQRDLHSQDMDFGPPSASLLLRVTNTSDRMLLDEKRRAPKARSAGHCYTGPILV